MKKPFYNAVFAVGYITLVVSFINSLSNFPEIPEKNIFIPIGMISLLVFSVVVMAFLFFYQPVLLLLEQKRAEALKFLFTTAAIFAGIAAIIIVIALFVLA